MRRNRTLKCPCGRGLKAKGRGICNLCHAEDMKERRRIAREAGTYTLKGVHVPRPTPRGTKQGEADAER